MGNIILGADDQHEGSNVKSCHALLWSSVFVSSSDKNRQWLVFSCSAIIIPVVEQPKRIRSMGSQAELRRNVCGGER